MGIKERLKKLEIISGTAERKYAEILTLPGGDGDLFRDFDNENAAILQKRRFDKVLIGEENNPGKHRAMWRAFDFLVSETGLYDCTGELIEGRVEP